MEPGGRGGGPWSLGGGGGQYKVKGGGGRVKGHERVS